MRKKKEEEMKPREINKLIERCIEYSLYMKELYFTKEEKEKLNKWVKKNENKKKRIQK